MTVTPTAARTQLPAPRHNSASEWIGMFDHRVDPSDLGNCSISLTAHAELMKHLKLLTQPMKQRLCLDEFPVNIVLFRTARINQEIHSQFVSSFDALLEAQPRARVCLRLSEVKECSPDTIRYLAERTRMLRASQGELMVVYTYDQIARLIRELGLRDEFNLHPNMHDALSHLLIDPE